MKIFIFFIKIVIGWDHKGNIGFPYLDDRCNITSLVILNTGMC